LIPPLLPDPVIRFYPLFLLASQSSTPLYYYSYTSSISLFLVPPFLQAGDPAGTVRHLVDELRSVTTATSRLRLGEDVIAKTVCRHAVKAHDTLRGPEIEQLIRDLLACELPYCCPHGRPTMVQISFLELEKKFGRKK